MTSEPREPGGPASIEPVLREGFGVPAMPSIQRGVAAQRVQSKLSAAGVPCERLELSDQPVRRGALFDAAGSRVPFPPGRVFNHCYVALIDPEIMARWAHPAHWAFVPIEGEGEVILQPTELPEHRTGSVRLFPVTLSP